MWLPTEVKVGVSPAPEGIICPRLEIQQVLFFFFYLLWNIKIESLEYWPWDLSLTMTLFLPSLLFSGLYTLGYLTSKSSLICISCNISAQVADPRDSFWWKASGSSGCISHGSLWLDLTLWTVLCTKELCAMVIWDFALLRYTTRGHQWSVWMHEVLSLTEKCWAAT